VWEPGDRTLLADDARLDQIAIAFAGVVDAKSPWTYRHSDRASVITLGMAGALDVDDRLMHDLRRAALLHDIGKLAVSNRILDKPARLTAAEFAQIRQHPLVTERILSRVPGCEHLAPVAGAHHERLDGSGYPRGLSAAQLTTPMRLLAVADVYEALTAPRPYRDALSSEDALAVIRADVPARFDRETFALLQRLLAEDTSVTDAARRAEAVFRAP
jgi:HD-GYP domain-containing protein (c-di-GMP phosphodiesterase class II)